MKRVCLSRKIRTTLLCTAVLLAAACSHSQTTAPTPGAEVPMVRLDPGQVPEFYDDLDFVGLRFTIEQTLRYLADLPPDHPFVFGADTYSTGHMMRSLDRFGAFLSTRPTRRQLNRFIGRNYHVYRSVGGRQTGRMLFTGYFEPALRGSLAPGAQYRYPVYTRPADLITIDLSRFSEKYRGEKLTGRIEGRKFVPYYDRRQIEQREGFDPSPGSVLLWVNDRIDLFFLQIQGSGKVYLKDGRAVHLHYQSANGRPYRSIGKLLIEQGKIDASKMSMQRIRAYLETHPQEVDNVLNYNPSYVFFQFESEGPKGYLDVRLTPGRSLAVDRRIFPMAALSYVETRKPLVDGSGRIDTWTTCRRFTVCQDTGGAIRGPGRADLFWGSGAYAEIAAGHMRSPGSLYFLVLKPDKLEAAAKKWRLSRK
jgi:membrane-bound lytic murein transglycosylase A